MLLNFFISFIFLVLCLGQSPNKEQIDPNDQKKIQLFFDHLIRSGNFAYTLFGEKPCSITVYSSKLDFSYDSIILEQGWMCWLSHNHLFPSLHFALKKINNVENRGVNEIILINKKKTLNVIKSNIKEFHKRLDTQISAEEILNLMLVDNAFLQNIFEKSDLVGILLGYGTINAMNFENRVKLSLAVNERSSPPYIENLNDLSPLSLYFVKAYSTKRYKSDPVFSNQEISILTQELDRLVGELDTFELAEADDILEKIPSPVFAFIQNDPETIDLHIKYARDREKVIEAYKNKPIFDVTMKQWMAL